VVGVFLKIHFKLACVVKEAEAMVDRFQVVKKDRENAQEPQLQVREAVAAVSYVSVGERAASQRSMPEKRILPVYLSRVTI
jgi:hypothetical protein